MSDQPLQGRIALITGASRGIGAAVAKKVSEAGAHLILVARTVGGLEEVDDAVRKQGGSATLMPLDLLDLPALDKLGPAIADKFGKLDIVVGNAGMVGTLTSVAHSDAKEWQRIMDLNVHANYRLIRTLDPLLRASDAGRAVFVTSDIVRMCPAYWGAYGASKAALEAMVKIYAAETVKTKLRVNLVSPGAVDTAMLAKAFPGGFQGHKKKPEDVAPVFLPLVLPSCTQHGETIKA